MQGTQTLWVKGNHDSKNFRYLALDNYFTDFENWRFIILDSSDKFGSSTGFLENSQISLLSEWLKTDKNVAIAMHHPPFFYNSRKNIYTTDEIPLYDDFFKALTPNVKYVFTGHWHFNQTSEINGISFITQKALTQDKVCNYTNLDL
jgi:3',5'-cyclic AMP phosphodiesterase CpdA